MQKGLPTIPKRANVGYNCAVWRERICQVAYAFTNGRYLRVGDSCLCRSHLTHDAAKNTVEEGTHAIPHSPRSGYVMNGTKGEWGTFMGRSRLMTVASNADVGKQSPRIPQTRVIQSRRGLATRWRGQISIFRHQVARHCALISPHHLVVIPRLNGTATLYR